MASIRKRKSKSNENDDHHPRPSRREESSSSWPPPSFLECSNCWDDDEINDPALSSSSLSSSLVAAATYGTCDNVSKRYQKICRVGEGTYGVVYRAFDRYHHHSNPRSRHPLSLSSSSSSIPRGKKNASANNAEKNNKDNADDDDGIVALKRCIPHYEMTDGFPLTTIREISILNDLRRSMSMSCRSDDDDDGNNSATVDEVEEHYIITLLDVTVSSSRSGVFLVFNYIPHTLASIIDTHNIMQQQSSSSTTTTNYHPHNNSKGRRSSSSSSIHSPFKESEIKQLMYQLLHALHYLHTHYIIHRDIKTSNLLYDDRVGLLRVADFGLARRVSPMECPRVHHDIGGRGSSTLSSYYRQHPCSLTPKVISLWSRPPEVLLGSKHYTTSIDIWGAGCVMGELLLGKPIMDGKDELDQLNKIFTFLGPPNSYDWLEMLDLPLIKSDTIDIPKQQHSWVNNNNNNNSNNNGGDGLHMLDVFRNWNCPSGIKLLLGLLTYNPSIRYTANEAMCTTDYFSTSIPPTPTIPSLMPKFPTINNCNSDNNSRMKK